MVRYRKVNNGPEDYPSVPNEHCKSEMAQRPSTSRRIRNPRWSTKEPAKRKTVSSDVAADPTTLSSTPEKTGWPTVLIPSRIVLVVLQPKQAVETDEAVKKHNHQREHRKHRPS